MTDPLKNEEENEEWVEISDGQGRKAALRHISAIHCGEKNYHLLGAVREGDGDEGGLLLVREDHTNDGKREYVVVHDDEEIGDVLNSLLSQVLSVFHAECLGMEPEEAPCGVHHHGAWEFCFCDEPEYLQ